MNDIMTGDLDRDTAWQGLAGGREYRMTVRPGTSDWNTCQAVALGEYPLPQGLTGWALDIGAHIGAVTVPLALLNPDLRILAVEALPENVAVLMANIERNGVQGQVRVVHAAASDSPEPVRIMYGEVADASGQHQFIGNEYGPEGSTYWTVKGATLRGLMLLRGPDEDCPFVWTKLDCEGCEYKVLASEWVTHLPVIIGEVHRGWDRLVQLLSATHDVTGDGQDFGHFQAYLKAQA